MLQNIPSNIRSSDVRYWVFVILFSLPAIGGAVERGDIAPAFSLPVIANPPLDLRPVDHKSAYALLHLADLRGKPVYVDFWATHCAPCRQLIPELTRLRDALTPQNLQVVAISTDPDPRQAVAFVNQYPTAVPILNDPGAVVASRYGVAALPMGFIISPQGRVLAVHTGAQGGLTESVREILQANEK